jgi:hypothetical protein
MIKVIANQPTAEMYATDLEIDCQCARCGSSCEWVDCWAGCEDGYVNRHEEDPLWYDDECDWPCDECHGRGGWQHCISSAEWCEANPLPGREDVRRGAVEWFTVGEPGGPAGGR